MIATLVLGCHVYALRDAVPLSAEPREGIHRRGTFDPIVVSFIDAPNTGGAMHSGSPVWHELVPPESGAVADVSVIASVQFESTNEGEPVASTSISDGQDIWTTSVAAVKASIEARWEPESNSDYFGCSVRLVPQRSHAYERYEIEITWCSDRDPTRRERLVSAVRNTLLMQQLPVKVAL